MIKDALSYHPDICATPYELNYLWRYGNSRLSHDMLDPEQHLSPRKAKYIRGKLEKMLILSGKQYLVEKTVANVLRLSYVHGICPDGKVIHIIRDGRAVTASAMIRWKARATSSYLMSKGLTIPPLDIPRVGLSFLLNRIKRRIRKRDYIQSWGPRWPGFDEDVARLPLMEICAMQWKKSIESASSQRHTLPKGQYTEIRYEEFVTDPSRGFDQLSEFLSIDFSAPAFKSQIEEGITTSSLDKWKTSFSGQDMNRLYSIIGQTLGTLGYE